MNDDFLSGFACAITISRHRRGVSKAESPRPPLCDSLARRIETVASLSFPQAQQQLRSLLSRGVEVGAEQVHFTWFTGGSRESKEMGHPPAGLPEKVIAHLPEEVRDPIALVLGTHNRSDGVLSEQTCCELAKALWAGLDGSRPGPELERTDEGGSLEDEPGCALDRVSMLADQLASVSSEELKELVMGLGLRMFGTLSARLPQRAAAAMCQRLEPSAARAVWVHRRKAAARGADIDPSRKLLAEVMGCRSAHSPTDAVARLGVGVLRAAVDDNPEICRWLAFRLPKALGALLRGASSFGENARRRSPATKLDADPDVARRWVCSELEAKGLSAQPPEGC